MFRSSRSGGSAAGRAVGATRSAVSSPSVKHRRVDSASGVVCPTVNRDSGTVHRQRQAQSSAQTLGRRMVGGGSGSGSGVVQWQEESVKLRTKEWGAAPEKTSQRQSNRRHHEGETVAEKDRAVSLLNFNPLEHHHDGCLHALKHNTAKDRACSFVSGWSQAATHLRCEARAV